MGKALNMPLYKLWGGYRDSVPVITIGGYYSEDADITRGGEGPRRFGLRRHEVQDRRTQPPKRMRCASARPAAPAATTLNLAVDANQGYTVAQAITFFKLVDDLNVMWFEEPCIWQNDRRAMRDVRYGGSIAVCAGQSEFSAAGCRDLMETGSIDFCNFDSSWSGGATEWRRAAAIASVYDVRMAHHEEPQMAAPLLASIPHGTFLEYFHPPARPDLAQRDREPS